MPNAEKLVVRVTVTPKAKRERFLALGPDSFLAAVREPAEHDAANVRVRELVAGHFRAPVRAVLIVGGRKGKRKTLHVYL